MNPPIPLSGGYTPTPAAATPPAAQLAPAATAAPTVNPNASFQTASPASPYTPKVTPIPSTVTPPSSTSGTGPALPTQQATTTATTYLNSVGSNLDAVKAQLDASNKAAIADKQTQIDSLNQNQTEIQQLEDNNMLSEGSTVAQETSDKQAALATEQKQQQDNYDANQALITEMDGLVQTGSETLATLQNTVGGTVGFMNAQQAKTVSDITARVGLIQSVISARNGQIGQAQAQLTSSLNAITSIATDQMNYYKAIQTYYDTQKTDNASQITKLTTEQQTYINSQIKQQEDAVTNAQATATNIQNAMLDPTKALAYAKAGVTLNDTIPEINQKLAVQAYAQETSDSANKMASAGYSSTPIPGVTPVTTTDSQGVQKNWYKPDTSGDFTIGNTRFNAEGHVIATVRGGAGDTVPVVTNGQTANVPIDVVPYYNTSNSGVPYADLSTVQGTATEKAATVAAASAAGIKVITNKNTALDLTNIEDANGKLDTISSIMAGIDQPNVLSRTLGGLGLTKLATMTQSNPQQAASGALQGVGLDILKAISGVQGFRGNSAVVQQITDHLPSIYDTNAVVQQKVAYIRNLIDDRENAILGQQGSNTSASASTSGAPSSSSNNPLGI